MKKFIKGALYFICAFSFIIAAVTLIVPKTGIADKTAYAADVTPSAAKTYYGDQLPAKSPTGEQSGEQKFYNAFKSMSDKGLAGNSKSIFEKGERYDLVANSVVTKDRIMSFANGSNLLLKEFAAAKDAFFMDNPQLFYIDADKISLSMSLYGGEYCAYIDAGNNETYFTDGFTLENLSDEISKFENKVSEVKKEIADKLKEAAKDADSSLNDPATQAAYTVHLAVEKIAEITKYALSYEYKNLSAEELGMPTIRTAYGVFGKGYAVCDGYAKAFKYLINKLGLRCVEIVGNYYDNNNPQPHAWNAVYILGKWYHVDPTFAASNKDKTPYILSGKSSMNNYEPTGKISDCGTIFSYQNIQKNMDENDFAANGVNDGLNVYINEENTAIKYSYTKFDAETGKYVTYNNSSEMQEYGLYLVVRHEVSDNSAEYLGDYWCYYGDEDGEFPFANYKFAQFAITTQAPDRSETGNKYASYNKGSFEESKIVLKSGLIVNENYDPNSIRPAGTVYIDGQLVTTHLSAENSYTIEIKYNSSLKKKDDGKPIGIYVYSTKSNNLSEYVTVGEGVKLVSSSEETDGKTDTIVFTFTPSKMYEHDSIDYNFLPTNVVADPDNGENGDEPKAVSLTFNRPWQVCSKVYPSGRLYVNAYGNPTLVDSSDLSLNGFTINGEQIAEAERSQLVLVATKPGADDEADMNSSSEELIKKESENAEILSSATYEINLNICGGLVRIPEHSYVRVAFGFPEGYSAKDAGVTFKVYHFKRSSDGRIDKTKTEEIECVVTEYGIVVTLNDFSPFEIVAVKNLETSEKNVYVRNVSGGKLQAYKKNSSGEEIEAFGIVSLVQGETLRYKITPDSGLKTNYVLVNKIEKTIENGEVILTYDELESNNEVVIGFIREDKFAHEDGAVSLEKSFVINEGKTGVIEKDKVSVALIIVVVSLSILLIASITFSILLLKSSARLSNRRREK